MVPYCTGAAITLPNPAYGAICGAALTYCGAALTNCGAALTYWGAAAIVVYAGEAPPKVPTVVVPMVMVEPRTFAGCAIIYKMQQQPQNRNNYQAHSSAESLEDVNRFFKPDTNSALSRHLSEAVWSEYKDMSCRSGVSFKTCVFSGVANLDSGIGAYAGSHDAYTTFDKFFDKIIQEYHGHSVTDRHVSDMDASRLTNADFSAEDSSMVNSTRIRVGRNLAGYPLGPGVTKAQRLEIMDKVV